VFSMRSRNPDLVGVIERRIDEFLLGEVPEERIGLERLAQVIEMSEARMRQGEDWTILVATKVGVAPRRQCQEQPKQ
jgi:hypothetical protein